MPHVTIKHFPKQLTDEARQQLAAEISASVQKHFETYAGAISISLEPVPELAWQESVYLPEIVGKRDLLIKTPRYEA